MEVVVMEVVVVTEGPVVMEVVVVVTEGPVVMEVLKVAVVMKETAVWSGEAEQSCCSVGGVGGGTERAMSHDYKFPENS